MSTPHERHLDRSTADQIIQRALEIDAERADSLTEAQIREIASELSVSSASVDQALAEQRARKDNASPSAMIPASPAGRWISRSSIVVSAVVVATLVAAVASRLFP